jgi:hypothetical protein
MLFLVDAAGAAANWTNTELPTNAELKILIYGRV